MAPTHCAIETCNTTVLNKPVGVQLHRCPKNPEMRNKWMRVLKNRCTMLNWSDSRICSKHFELKYFDSQRRLRDNAVPTLFASPVQITRPKPEMGTPKSKVDRLLNKLTQAELTANVKYSLNRMKEPANLDSFVTEDLRCRPEATTEAQLWLIIKKQQHLNTRLMNLVVQTKKHVEILENNTQESNSVKKEHEQNIESLKYIVKCLQEKQATLEEQIEILTTVESR